MVENGSQDLRAAVKALAPLAGKAMIVGLTGSPGVGKSSLTSALVAAFRAKDRTVGVLAVDPSSPFTGGALLGDRVRMQDHATDPRVFIRSMASRGHLGGLSWATPQALRVMDAGGADVILLETVGVGQAEVEVAGTADTTLVLLAPGMGDGIQVAKAGILEIADVFVINKAERDGAAHLARDLKAMLELGAKGEWEPPIVKTTAIDGHGVEELVAAIEAHWAYLEESGELRKKRLHRAATEVREIALSSMRVLIGDVGEDGELAELAGKVLEGSMDPFEAAEHLVERFHDSSS